MIYLNQQLENGRTYKSTQEMYPELYRKGDFGYYQCTHISVKIKNGDIYIQTDWNDPVLINEYLQRDLKHKLKTAKARVQENLEIINAIEKVL